MQRRKVAILSGLALLLVAMAPRAAATPEGVPEGTAVPAATQEAYTGGNLTAFSAGGTVLTVYGGGSAATVPDQVEIRLGVGGAGSSPGAAEDALEQLAARIRQQLNAKGVKYSLTRSFFTVWPVGGAGEKAPRFEGSSDYRLVLSEPAQVDTALAAVSAAGVVRVHEVRHLATGSALRREALRAAVESARATAAELARCLGKNVGETLAIEEVPSPPPGLFPEDRTVEASPETYRLYACVRFTCRLR